MSRNVNRRSLIVVLGFLLFVITFVLIAGILAEDSKNSTDWYQWRGPNRTGISTESNWTSTFPSEGPKQLWKVSLGQGFSTVSVSKGKLYTMGNINKRDFVYCFNANTGEPIWKYSYSCKAEGGGHPGPGSTPTVDGNYVYTLSREGDFFCFDANTGNVLWYKDVKKEYGAKPPTWQFTSSPLIYDDMVIIDVGISVALNKNTGKLVWKTQDYEGGYSSPYKFTVGKSPRIAVFNGYGLVILDPKTGVELGKYKFGPDNKVNVAIPIIYDNKAFISSSYGIGCALVDVSTNNLSMIYENKNMKNHMNSSVLSNGYIYGFDESELKCLDFQTGEVKWSQKGLGKSSLMVADGKMIILTEKGDLVIAEVTPNAYKEISRAKVLSGLCWTVPVLSGGKIYCRNHEGNLVCLDVKGK
jgi:outer membrane protein assembly factor BamB